MARAMAKRLEGRVLRLEPISIFRACATETIWRAVLDGRRCRVLYVHKAPDGDEMRPNRPVPLGLAAKRESM